MSGIINAYILKGSTGTWLTLPIGKDDFQKTMSEVGAVDPGTITIGKYKTSIAAIPAELLMDANLNHVNYLAERLSRMDGTQLDLLDAIMESPFRFTTLEQFIDYAANEDYFLFKQGIYDAVALGRYYIFDTGLCQMPEKWKDGIDLEQFGTHAARQERGVFTSKGYLTLSGDEWQKELAEQGIPGVYCLI